MDDARQPPPPGPDELTLTEGGPEPAPELFTDDPLSRDAARAILDRAAELLAEGDYRDAGVHYRRLVAFEEPAVRAAALLGLAEVLYRLDQDDAAIATWESILELPETPSTYQAWRNVAAARVRERDLSGAISAYREAERRAPPPDRAEIANRLGWLAKETGNTGAARRYFAKGRGTGPAFPLTWVVIGITVVTSMMARAAGGEVFFDSLALDKVALADGQLWRLWTVTLVHGTLLHLGFNMIALYMTGPIVEQIYGSRLFVLFYLLSAAGGSVGSFLFGGPAISVGASGAIFGLFGVLLAASRTHHPVLDRQSRGLVGRIGTLILLNIVFGFSVAMIDNAAHIGGLIAGLWLGFLIAPGRVTTLRSLWRPPASDAPQGGSRVLPAVGVAALVAVLAIGVYLGMTGWRVGLLTLGGG
jgi:membrane associated rhomboid family serine protease